METAELKVIPLFASLPENELETVAGFTSRTWVMKGRPIAKQGDFAYKFFAILAGTASVTVSEQAVATLGVGDVFGEMALIEDQLRNADVIAGDDLHLATMASWDFREALATCPTFKASIDRIVASRK